MTQVSVNVETLERWKMAMCDWDQGGAAALAEIDTAIASQDEVPRHSIDAMSAVYDRAFNSGYTSGLKEGLDEVVWLKNAWPLLTLVSGIASMIAGFLIGVWA